MRETAGLAAQWGIALEDMPAFPVKTIISGTEAAGVEHVRERGARAQARASMQRMSSLQDLERGQRLEVEETLGYVVTNAVTAGLAVPTVDTCYRLISGINRYVQRVSG
jgi:ketopantoate reductase